MGKYFRVFGKTDCIDGIRQVFNGRFCMRGDKISMDITPPSDNVIITSGDIVIGNKFPA